MDFEKIYQQLKNQNINAELSDMGNNITITANSRNVIASITPDPFNNNKARLVIGDDQGFEGDVAFIKTKQDADALLKTVQIVKPYLN